MPPSSGERKAQESIKKTTDANRKQRKTKKRNGEAKIAAAIESLRYAQETQTSHEDASDKKNRRINKWTLFLVSLTVVFTGLSWWVFHGQLNEMRSEQRPWLYASDIAIAGRIVSVEEYGVYAIPLKFSIKNTGHLPAFSVVQKTAATILKVGQSTMSVTNDVCDSFRNSSDKGGMTMFANQTVTHGGFTSDDYPVVSKQLWNSIGSDRLIVMFGCIDYQFPAEPGHHQTRFAFAVGTKQTRGILERIGTLPDDPTTVDIHMLPVSINDGTPAD